MPPAAHAKSNMPTRSRTLRAAATARPPLPERAICRAHFLTRLAAPTCVSEHAARCSRKKQYADALPNAPCRCDSAPAAPRKSDMPRAFSDAPRRADVRFRTYRPLLTQKAICRYVPGSSARIRSHALPACADPRRICAYVQTTARRGISANGRAHSVIPSVAAPHGHDITETS